MNAVARMKEVEDFKHLSGKLQKKLFSGGFCSGSAPLREVNAIAEFHHKEWISACKFQRVKPDKILVFQTGDRF